MKKIIFSILLTAGLFNTLYGAAASTDTTAAQDVIRACPGADKLFSGLTEEETNQVLTKANSKDPSPEVRNNHIKNLVAHVDHKLPSGIRLYLMMVLPVGQERYWEGVIGAIIDSDTGPSAAAGAGTATVALPRASAAPAAGAGAGGAGASAAAATTDPLIAGACFDPYAAAAAAAAADSLIGGAGANPYAAAATTLPRSTATAGAGSAAAADDIDPFKSPNNYRVQMEEERAARPPVEFHSVPSRTQSFRITGSSRSTTPPLRGD